MRLSDGTVAAGCALVRRILSPLFAVLLLAVTAAAQSPEAGQSSGSDWGQPPPTAQAPTTQSPAPASTATAPAGRVHVIKKGDTMWDLAKYYLGDNFVWPKIWERNSYVTDAHWIYPGNTLVIEGDGSMGVQGRSGGAGAVRGAGFDQLTAGFLDRSAGAAASAQAEAAVADSSQVVPIENLGEIVREKVLTASFLAAVPFLWTAKDSKGLLYPGEARIDPRSEQEVFKQYDNVPISVFGRESFSVGDTVEFYRSERMMTIDKRKANLVRRTAYGAVTEVAGNRVLATAFKTWDVVRRGDRVGRITTVASVVVREYIDPSSPLSATVVERVEQNAVPYPYDSFIINRGSNAGVRLGDIFVTNHTGKNRESARPAQLAFAAHVGDDNSTLVILKVFQSALYINDSATLIKQLQ